MRQKPGIRPTTPTVDAPGNSTQRPRTPDSSTDDPVFGPANRFSPEGSTVSSAPVKPAQDPALDNTALKSPTVVETAIPAPAPSRHDVRTPLLEPYVQQVSSKLPAPDENGLRIFKNRRFVDVEVVDGVGNSTRTVMVEFDTRLNTYRAKSPHEQGAFGPPLYRSVTGDVWSLNKPTTYFDNNRYTVSHLPDAQGYYAVSYGGSPVQAPESGFAFRDEQHRWVRVDPAQARGDASVPVNLAQWTDGDIWKPYRIHGPEILLFRAEVQQTGKVRAARVDNIYAQAGADADAIEKATWAGDNQAVSYRKEVVAGDGTFFVPVTRYDQLIDEVAASGKPVLELPKDVEVLANDIVWPVPEHYRT
jgi:hypothetical protein